MEIKNGYILKYIKNEYMKDWFLPFLVFICLLIAYFISAVKSMTIISIILAIITIIALLGFIPSIIWNLKKKLWAKFITSLLLFTFCIFLSILAEYFLIIGSIFSTYNKGIVSNILIGKRNNIQLYGPPQFIADEITEIEKITINRKRFLLVLRTFGGIHEKDDILELYDANVHFDIYGNPSRPPLISEMIDYDLNEYGQRTNQLEIGDDPLKAIKFNYKRMEIVIRFSNGKQQIVKVNPNIFDKNNKMP